MSHSTQNPVRHEPLPPGGSAGKRVLWPGLLMVVPAAGVALVAGQFLPATVSPLLIAMLLGLLLRNAVRLPAALDPGLEWAAKKPLRAGVVLLGLQLPLSTVVDLGPGLIMLVVAVVGLGITVTLILGRLLRIGFTQRLLIACGFSICGASAVAATDAVIDAEDEEVVTAIALVVLFGTLMIPLVPLLGTAIGLDDHQQGIWAGAAIHEVAQVVAAGGAVGGGALAVAVVVKLARVLMLAPVLAVIGARQRRVHGGGGSGDHPPLVPLFVIGFVVMAVVRTLNVLPPIGLEAAGLAQTALLTAAMFALGCGVRVSRLRKVGPRPFLLAASSTVIVGGIGLSGAVLFG